MEFSFILWYYSYEIFKKEGIYMKILSVNAGSSSLKFQMYEMPEEKVLISGVFERIGIDGSFYTIKLNGEKIKKEVVLSNHGDAVKILVKELFDNKVIESLEEIDGVGHRVVHGGAKYASSVVINGEVTSAIEELFDLAPLHNPANLLAINAFKKELPDTPNVAVFDTSFQASMEKEEYIYPVPYEWYTDYSIRKYGFHGISHNYLANRMSEILGKDKFKIITCHLGGGCSIEAIADGKCVDTSLGFSPNSGLMMGTRCGDIDVQLIPFVMDKSGLSLDEVMNALTKKSGFLGVSGVSSDSRDIEAGVDKGDERCILAQKMFVNRCVDYIAKFYVKLGGVDAICFAAGLGENSITTRKQIVDKLGALGIKLDDERNNVRGVETLISSDDSSVPVWIIPTDEEVMIARDTYDLIK